MGSLSKIDLAYIAGFLDGDGSLMLQIKKRKDSKLKRRFMTTICFYQDTRHEKSLYWIRGILNIGYISRRNDGMTELRINGYKQVRDILKRLMPFVKFKKVQTLSLYKAAKLLSETSLKKLNKKQLILLVGFILKIQNENYTTKRKKTKEELFQVLDITP